MESGTVIIPMIASRYCGKWLVLLHVLALGISSALGGAKEKGGITWVGSEEEKGASKLSLNRASFFVGFDSPAPAWLFEALPGSNRTRTRAGADSPTVFNSAGDRVKASTGDYRVWSNEFNAASFFNMAPFAFRRTAAPLAPTSTVKELDGGGPHLANWADAVEIEAMRIDVATTRTRIAIASSMRATDPRFDR